MKKYLEQIKKHSCLNMAKPDEFIFVLLARDESAPVAIEAWIAHRLATGKNVSTDEQIIAAQNAVLAMRETWTCRGCGWKGPLGKALSRDGQEPPQCPICG